MSLVAVSTLPRGSILDFFRLTHSTIDQTTRGLLLGFILGGMGILPDTLLSHMKVSNDAIYVGYDMLIQNTVAFLFEIALADEVGFCLIAKKNASCVAEAITGNVAKATDLLLGGSNTLPSPKLHTNPWVNIFSAVGGVRFLRFVICVFINLQIALPIYMLWLRRYPASPLWQRRLVKMAIEATTFLVFGNILKFSWAYRNFNDSKRVHDLVVVVFAVAACLSFMNTPNAEKGEEGEVVMNVNAKFIIVFTTFVLVAFYQILHEMMTLGVIYNPTSVLLKVLPGVVSVSSIFAGALWVLFRKKSKTTNKSYKGVEMVDWVYSVVSFVLCTVGLLGLIIYFMNSK